MYIFLEFLGRREGALDSALIYYIVIYTELNRHDAKHLPELTTKLISVIRSRLMSTFGKDETQRYGSPTTQTTYKFDRPHTRTIYIYIYYIFFRG